MSDPILVEITRGGLVESAHHGSAAEAVSALARPAITNWNKIHVGDMRPAATLR